MSYEIDQQALAEREAEVRFALESNHELGKIYSAFPQLIRNQANNGIFVEYCKPGPINFQQVVRALQPGNSELINELAIRTEEQAREALAEEISKHSGGDAKSKEAVCQALLANFKVGRAYENTILAQTPKFTTTTLQEKASEAVRRAGMAKKSPAELREIVKQGSVRAQREPVPASLTRKAYAALSTDNQRKALHRFGADELNAAWRVMEGR